ncbi:MAG: hemerythrin domain-containing protein [Burkholderiales bacterium]
MSHAPSPIPAVPAAPRHDVYVLIHKALRAAMSDALLTLGSLDAADAPEVSDALAKVTELLDLCQEHLEMENRFIHPAMEARQPGSTAGVAAEHVHHEATIAALRRHVESVARAPSAARERAAADLYQALGVFVGENLVHMQEEESAHNAVLWATHTDAELMALEATIKAHVPPPRMAYVLRWMLPAASPAQRAQMLRGVRAHAPAPVFEGVLGIARAHLDAAGWRKLDTALAA